jgi:hypothetical protein
MWKPAIDAAFGAGVYPMFASLAAKTRRALDDQSPRRGA